MPLSIPDFVARWKASALTERAAAQSHFIDLCEVLGQPHPVAADQVGDTFTFEKHVSKLKGGKGYADVWKRGFFAWEYKGKHKNLQEAYLQLADYREDLENPPLLIVCDQDRFEVHTNFTGTAKWVYSFGLDDLLSDQPTPNSALAPLAVLRAAFTDPEQLKPESASRRVTEQVAAEFGTLARNLRDRGEGPEQTAHFLMRLIFCLFADSIGLLPENLFRQMIARDAGKPASFTRRLRQLFAAMSTSGNNFGPFDIHWFNGGLFADETALELTGSDMMTLRKAAALDWSGVEPSIFGTLFERGLNPDRRSQLGAHYTSPQDILLIVEPVVMDPLRARWVQVRAEASALAEGAKNAKGATYNKIRAQMQETLYAWVAELSHVRILDPACGSGNFLYLALKRLLDLWQEARIFAAEHGLPTVLPEMVHPSQLYGMELNTYAHELASVVVWIGYLQWLQEHGMGVPREPILQKLENIRHGDAILSRDKDGNPVQAEWPEADFIIGNPPFKGGNKLRSELGDEYADALFLAYKGALPATCDLVCYWFERARVELAKNSNVRVGLLATQSIRGGANRTALEKIQEQGGSIFMAWSDRPWILDGAVVNVALIGFDGGFENHRHLNGTPVERINSNLTAASDTTTAFALDENRGLWAYGTQAKGSFDITDEKARHILSSTNPFGLAYDDVVRQSFNGGQLLDRQSRWVIDFGEDMTLEEAALYEAPFSHVETIVWTERQNRRERRQRTHWWLHARPSPKYRKILRSQKRYIASPVTSKHRLFVWLEPTILIDHQLVAFAFEDDYSFGVLHSRIHEVWSRALGTQTRDAESGFRYTPTSTFDTFPFPWAPGKEPQNDPLVLAVAQASRDLVEMRDKWLNPIDAKPEVLAQLTLTGLYNERPAWLNNLHERLDNAVSAAYGWSGTPTEAQILQRLLALNHERGRPQCSQT